MDRFVLEVRQTRAAKALGRRHVLEAGEEIRVGRAAPSEVVVPDEKMSGTHFRVKHNGRTAYLEDLRSIASTTVNAERVTGRVALAHGAWVHAGTTDFMAFYEAETLRRKPELLELGEIASQAFHDIAAEPTPIFAVLDCARDGRILPLLRESVDEHRCLFEGPRGRASEEQAPHLVAFRDDSDLLRVLIGLGWGQRFGIYFGSDRPFEELRRHFRRLLLVADEETNERLYFRFYDPGVLRSFLPAASRPHQQMMFGPVAAYLVEGPGGQVVRMKPEDGA